MGGVEKGSSLPVVLVGLGWVFLVGDGYVAIEDSAGLGGSISHVFEYGCEGGVVVFPYVDLADAGGGVVSTRLNTQVCVWLCAGLDGWIHWSRASSPRDICRPEQSVLPGPTRH